MRYLVTMHRWVPQFAQVEVEAATEEEARSLARAEVDVTDYWTEEAGLSEPPRDWSHMALEEMDAPIIPGQRIVRRRLAAA